MEIYSENTNPSGRSPKKREYGAVLGWIEEEMAGQGHEIVSVTLQDKEIKGCLACGKCKEVTDRPGCIQKDDANGILDTMTASDLVLFSSPLYFWGLAGPLKSFIDRTYSLYNFYHHPNHYSLVKGQRQALLLTGGGPYENNAEPVFTAFSRLQKPHIAVNVGELYLGGCKSLDSLGEESRDKASSFARTILA